MLMFAHNRNLRISSQVPTSSAAPAQPGLAFPGVRKVAPACDSTEMPMALAGQSDVQAQCLLQTLAQTQTAASFEKLCPAPVSAGECPFVPDVQRLRLQEEPIARANCGRP